MCPFYGPSMEEFAELQSRGNTERIAIFVQVRLKFTLSRENKNPRIQYLKGQDQETYVCRPCQK